MKPLCMVIAVTMALIVAGCAGPSHGIIDLEPDKVVVIENGDMRSPPEDIDRLAREGCALHGRTAVPVSIVQEYDGAGALGYRYRHLYTCLDPESDN